MIDWEQAEEKPEKSQKVEGRVLLDLRAKMVELERELALKKGDVKKLISDLKETQTKLQGREKSLVKMTEKFTAAKKNLDSVSEEKLDVDIELTKLKPSLEEVSSLNEELKETIKKQKSEFEAQITELKGEIKFLNQKNEELEQQLSFKEKSARNQKTEIDKQIKEMEQLKSNLKIAQDERDQLVDKIGKLKKDLSEIESSPEILKQIKETLSIKGFLSDKELAKIEKEYLE